MCVYSMIMDHYRDDWERKLDEWLPKIVPITPTTPLVPWPPDNDSITINPPAPREPPITDEEIRQFRKLLERAKEYDKKNNEPDCELEEKKAALRKIAEKMGIDLGDF